MILNVLNFNILMLCWVFHQYGIMNKFTYCYISHFSNVKGKRVSLRLKNNNNYISGNEFNSVVGGIYEGLRV